MYVGNRLMLRFGVASLAAAAAVAALIASPGGTAAAGQVGTTRVDVGVVDVDTRLGLENSGGAGTGIVLSRGLVLTNNHVIRGATAIRVRDVGNGRTYAARVVGYAFLADVAVLRVGGGAQLTAAPIGDSAAVHVGDRVIAVGNAGGAGGKPSVSRGRVRAVGRALVVGDGRGGSQRLTGLIETSTPLQPGDSGGPLLSSTGRVIGIDTAASFQFEFQPRARAGFAIPINRALSIARQIQAGRSSATVHVGPTAFLGVQVAASRRGQGALVQGVVPRSAADRVGLVPGDVIISANGKTVSTPLTLTKLMIRVVPGSRLPLRWLDQLGNSHTAVARPGVGPPQ